MIVHGSVILPSIEGPFYMNHNTEHINTYEVVLGVFVLVATVVESLIISGLINLTMGAVHDRYGRVTDAQHSIQAFSLLSRRPGDQVLQLGVDAMSDVIDDAEDGGTMNSVKGELQGLHITVGDAQYP